MDHGKVNNAQSSDAAFNDVASLVLLDIGDEREATALLDLIQPLRNGDTDMMPSQPSTNTAMAICPVPSHLLRPSPATRPEKVDRLKHGFDLQRRSGLPSTGLDCQLQYIAESWFRQSATAHTPVSTQLPFIFSLRVPTFHRKSNYCGVIRAINRAL